MFFMIEIFFFLKQTILYINILLKDSIGSYQKSKDQIKEISITYLSLNININVSYDFINCIIIMFKLR